MPNLLSQGVDWLAGQRQTHMSSTVTYRRGADSVEVSATLGQTEFDQDDRSGMIVRGQVRDYLISAAALILGAAVVLPQRGDRIEETVDGVTHTYEVLPMGGSQQHYRFSDPFRKTLRIHTKHISSEAVS